MKFLFKFNDDSREQKKDISRVVVAVFRLYNTTKNYLKRIYIIILNMLNNFIDLHFNKRT